MTQLSPTERLEIAFVVRQDVSQGALADDTAAMDRFLAWWVCAGRREHRPIPLDASVHMRLWRCDAADEDVIGAAWPSLLSGLFAFRSDLTAQLRLAEPGGRARALCWFYKDGLDRFALWDTIEAPTRDALAQPVETEPGDRPAISILMRALHAADPDLTSRFDLTQEAGRLEYWAWWITQGLETYSVAAWLSDAQRAHLDRPCAEFDEPSIEWRTFLTRIAAWGQVPLSSPYEAESRAALNHWRSGVAALPAPPVPARPPIPPKPAVITEPLRDGVTLIGFAEGQLGLGEDVRLTASACEAAGAPCEILDVSHYLNGGRADTSAARFVVDAPTFRFNVFCMSGLDTCRMVLDRYDVIENRYAIGYWPWELPRWPKVLTPAFNAVDEVWASSRFAQAAYQGATEKPITLMPLPVVLGEVAARSKSAWGLDPDRFAFLYVFDANSFLTRKNPLAAIDAFQAAFPDPATPVALVLKVMNANAEQPIWAETTRRAAEDSRIRILTDTLARAAVYGLMAACDAYVSLHRAEGFGRTLAEAMLLGKPVVATAWSGSDMVVDETTAWPVSASMVRVEPGAYPFGEDQVWADPDPNAAAETLRAVFTQSDAVRTRCAAARARVLERHSLAAVGAAIVQRLEAIAAEG